MSVNDFIKLYTGKDTSDKIGQGSCQEKQPDHPNFRSGGEMHKMHEKLWNIVTTCWNQIAVMRPTAWQVSEMLTHVLKDIVVQGN